MPKRQRPKTPLGEYITDQRGTMSIREAARRAGISEGRWRQVELGYQKMAGGLEAPVHPRPETVVAMCKAVAADPQKGLELAGHRADQYKWLLSGGTEMLADADRLEWFPKLSLEEREAVIAELQRRHVQIEVDRARKAR